MSHHNEHSEHKHHILPLWMYLSVAATLLVMTGVTIGAAYIDFNHLTGIASMNFIIAMLIATFKAGLVALIFMHLWFDNKFYLFALVSAIGCLLIFIALTMSDTEFRGKVNPIEKGPIVNQVPAEKFIQSKAGEHSTDTPASKEHAAPATTH
jgi:cytochrome c oxidase subunit 4